MTLGIWTNVPFGSFSLFAKLSCALFGDFIKILPKIVVQCFFGLEWNRCPIPDSKSEERGERRHASPENVAALVSPCVTSACGLGCSVFTYG
jgi:hypothetical protein